MAQCTKHTARTRARKSTASTLTLMIVGVMFLLLQQWGHFSSGGTFNDILAYWQAGIIDVPSVSPSSGAAVVETRKNMDDHKDTTMAPGTATGTVLPPIPNNTIQTPAIAPAPATVTATTAATRCVNKRITTAQQHRQQLHSNHTSSTTTRRRQPILYLHPGPAKTATSTI